MTDLKDIQEKVQARIAKEQADVGAKKKDGKPEAPPPLSREYVIGCARARDKGNGEIFAALMQGKIGYVPEGKFWLQWQGHRWADMYPQEAEAAVEKVADEYDRVKAREEEDQRTAIAEDDKDEAKRHKQNAAALRSAIWSLHSTAGVQACLKMSLANENPLLIPARKLDLDPYILGCPNGIVDIRTGELRPGRPEDYVTLSCRPEWQGLDASCPLWESTVLEIFGGKPETAYYFHKLIGYAFFGRVTEKLFIILLGEEGDSGKTTLMETLYAVAGDYAAPMPVEMLLDQGRPENPNSPTPSIMALKGARLTWASEPGENRRFSVERVKLMSGNDSLTGRYGYDRKMQSFEPSHTLFLLTNHKLRAPAHDTPFWNRVRLLECPYSFVANPKPGTNQRPRRARLKEEILETESAGILAWIVRGYMAYAAEGLEPPDEVRASTESYKNEEDLAGTFIDECLKADPFGEIFAADMYELFRVWFQSNYGRNAPSVTTFGRMASRHLVKAKKGRKVYQGYSVKDEIANKYKGKVEWLL